MNTHVLFKIFIALLLAVVCLAVQYAAAQEPLPKTPADYEGPFYPVTKQEDEDNDLIHVKGRSGTARGDMLNLHGVVLNTRGEPWKGITIEIWQTDPNGMYLHPGDPTPGERDPDFQYWGRDTTDDDGAFSFKTILPGAYHPRPAHIHYKLWQNGNNILTSQIYFRKLAKENGRMFMTDRIDSQTVELQETPDGELKAFFRIVL